MLVAKFCQCEKGRVQRASWDVPYGVRKREERIQKALEKVPPSHGPVHGLHEWNPLGFWEDTQEEHDRWCAAKRKQVEDIKRGREEFEEKRRMEKKVIAPGSLRRVLDETLAQVAEAKRSREPGEDEEEEEDVVAF